MIVKKPYEISLWRDVPMYVGTPKTGKISPTLNIQDLSSVEYQYYTEEKIVVLGSDTMTSLARAINPVYKRNVNGTEQLTFEMYYQYEEPITGELVHNPIIDLVIDERKVKLKYLLDGETDPWHDFIIKKDDERARDNKYSFTCTGLAANELGKNGFNLEFNIELENNLGTIDELTDEVLKESDWQRDQSLYEPINQITNEALYTTTTNQAITAYKIQDDQSITVPSGARIYIYYTPMANQQKDYFQFIYSINNPPPLLEDKVTIHCDDTNAYDLYINNVVFTDDKPNFCNVITVSNYRGDRYVRKQLTHYDPTLKKSVGVYTKVNGGSTEYYGYSTTEYMGVDSVVNYIYNSNNFKAPNYWYIYSDSGEQPILSTVTFPYTNGHNMRTETFNDYLWFNFKGGTNARLRNDGIIQNYNKIKNFEKGQEYRLKLKIRMAYVNDSNRITSITQPLSNSPITCQIASYTLGYVITTIHFNFTSFTMDSDGYLVSNAICINDATWEDLSKNVSIFFLPVSNNNTHYLIEDAQFFRAIPKEGGGFLEINEVPQVRIHTEWHFYNPENNIGKIDADSYEYDGTDPNNYIAKYGDNGQKFEKRRSITISESNRYNIIQELSEIFECWARFKVYHDIETGKIATESYYYYKAVDATSSNYTQYYFYDWITRSYLSASGTEYNENRQYYQQLNRIRQQKRVYFINSVVQENSIGFKYGINLKDVQRTLDSDQIATKIIVKNNAREEAENGFCSIARAKDNPIRENFALNLDYYTSQGILNKTLLDNDLYLEGVGGSIGLYPRLARLNQQRNDFIEEQALLENEITNLTANTQAAYLAYNAASDELTKILDPISGTLYQNSGYIYDDFLDQFIRPRQDNKIPAYADTIYLIQEYIWTLIDATTFNSNKTNYYYFDDAQNSYIQCTNESVYNSNIDYYIKGDDLNSIIGYKNKVLNSYSIEQGTISNGSNSNSNYRVRTDGYISVEAGHTYTFNSNIQYILIDNYSDETSGSYMNQSGWRQVGENGYSYKIPDGVNYIRIVLAKNSSTGTAISPSDVEFLNIYEHSELSFYQEIAWNDIIAGDTYYYINNGHFVAHTYSKKENYPKTYKYYQSFTVNDTIPAGTYFETSENVAYLSFSAASGDSPQIYIYLAHRREDPYFEPAYYSSYTHSIIEKIHTYQKTQTESQELYEDYNDSLMAEQEKAEVIKQKLKEIARNTDEIEKEFNVKYARYIQEGTWTDDNYIDDDLYYLDALNVLYQSAYPKLTYNITVLELSQLEGYETYKFDLGHKTFMEDTEFFGYVDSNVGPVPAREWVIVTESTFNLDENEKNSLKVQNYKAHFEDLFQRITAATQSLEYHTGEYAKAANVVTPEGTIDDETMQRTLATAAYVIQNSHDQSVTWDDTGLQAVNLSDPSQIVRLASSGILISSDGGQTWSTAITGYGINADRINTGVLDTNKIEILNGAYPTFKWDSRGLHAFSFTENEQGNIYSYDPSRYVTFDRFGLYGIRGLSLDQVNFETVEEVQNNALFALTWNGLFIRNNHTHGSTAITPEEDLIVSDGTRVRAHFGYISNDSDANSDPAYGMQLFDASGNPTVVTQSDGTLWLQDSMRIGTSTQTNTIYIGVGEEDSGNNRYKVIKVDDTNNNEKFVVYSDGTFRATAADITGTINATGGQIGNMSIATLSDTIGVRITPSNGTFKVNGSAATPASIEFTYKTSVTVSGQAKWKHSTSTPINFNSGTTSGNSYTYTYNSSDFNNGVMYLGVQISDGTRTYTDTIPVEWVKDGQNGVSYTYAIESSLGNVINTSTLPSGTTTTTISGSIYKTTGDGAPVDITSSASNWSWKYSTNNGSTWNDVPSSISGYNTSSFNYPLADWTSIQFKFSAQVTS